MQTITTNRASQALARANRAELFDYAAFLRGVADYDVNVAAHNNGAAQCYGQATRSQIKGSGPDSPQWRLYYSAWFANENADGRVYCASAACGAELNHGDVERAHVVPVRAGGCYCGCNIVLTHSACNDDVDTDIDNGGSVRVGVKTPAVLLSSKLVRVLFPTHPAGTKGRWPSSR